MANAAKNRKYRQCQLAILHYILGIQSTTILACICILSWCKYPPKWILFESTLMWQAFPSSLYYLKSWQVKGMKIFIGINRAGGCNYPLFWHLMSLHFWRQIPACVDGIYNILFEIAGICIYSVWHYPGKIKTMLEVEIE